MTNPSRRVLAVDPGEKRIGLALSDPTGTIASPLIVLAHVSREEDARRIAALALEHHAGMIVVGQALDSQGEEGMAARKSRRLANVIQRFYPHQVVLWDEGGSTQRAREAYIEMGVAKHKRRGHLDQIAATVILQSYLEAQPPLPTLIEEKHGKENDA